MCKNMQKQLLSTFQNSLSVQHIHLQILPYPPAANLYKSLDVFSLFSVLWNTITWSEKTDVLCASAHFQSSYPPQ